MPGSRFVLREPLLSHQSLEATSGVEQTPVGDAGGWDDDGDGDGSSGMINHNIIIIGRGNLVY